MKKILVHTNDGRATKLEGASWHVDELGYLHVRGNSGNVGSFHMAQWSSVEYATD